MPVESVYQRLEPLLPRVRKPIAYVGGEVNSVVKDWDTTDVRWALLYPDAYEVGLPNQGVQILYEILNERDGVLAERTYSVWPDLEALMREHGLPQFTVDAHRPVGAFDVLGVSFSTELGYTNLLTALDLAGIPLHEQGPGSGRRHLVSARHRRRSRRLQSRADRRLPGRRGAGGRRRGRAGHHRRHTGMEAQRAAGWPRRAAGHAGRRVPPLRAALLRRFLPPGRPDRRGGAQPARCAAGRGQAHGDGPRRVAVPEQADRPGRRDRARAVQRGDLPWLHAGLPLLPGRHDHPSGA